MEEVEDEDSAPRPCYTRFVRPYPRPAATPICRGKTKFETLLEQQTADGMQPWEPFAQLATWLMANVGQTLTDEYLKLPIVSLRSLSIISLLTVLSIRFTREVISHFITTTCS